MVDVVPPDVRSRMMSGIRSKDTKPEMILRRGLHERGFRYRLHDKKLPGKPDLVFPRYHAVLFAHGCFWHGHDCHLFKWPKTRPEFWRNKICRNKEVDKRTVLALEKEGWRIGVVWECAIKGKEHLPVSNIISNVSFWIQGDEKRLEIRGLPS